MYIGGLWEGISPFFFFVFSLATSPTKGSHVYIYIYIRIYRHTMFVFFSFLFPGNLHESLDILWQPLRKSDNLRGSLAIPSQVYEHWRIEHDVAKTLHFQKRGKMGAWQRTFLYIYIYTHTFIYVCDYICLSTYWCTWYIYIYICLVIYVFVCLFIRL